MKNYILTLISACCILIGALSTWLVMIGQIDNAYDSGRQFERAEIHRTLVKVADTHNIYMIPGYPEAFAPKRSLRGLKIINVKNAKEAAKKNNQ